MIKNTRFTKKHGITNTWHWQICQITRKLVLYIKTDRCLMNIIYLFFDLRPDGPWNTAEIEAITIQRGLICDSSTHNNTKLITHPDWKTRQLSTRYRAWQGDFQACHAWQNSCSWRSRMTAFNWNHNGAWNLFSQKLLWLKSFIRVFWAASVPRAFSGVSRRLIQGGNLVERAQWWL